MWSQLVAGSWVDSAVDSKYLIKKPLNTLFKSSSPKEVLTVETSVWSECVFVVGADGALLPLDAGLAHAAARHLLAVLAHRAERGATTCWKQNTS